MPQHTYLIIGGGMTADAAVKGIRSLDPVGSIAVITAEHQPPYKRPPLTKALWKGEPFESIFLKTPGHNVEFFLSTTVKSIDPAEKTAIDEHGVAHRYEKLLLAIGGRVRTLPFDVEGIIYFRTADDYQNLRARTKEGSRVVVIGGGFIGSEIAAALTMNARQVSMVFPDPNIGGRIYPIRLAAFITGYYRSKGVTLYAGDKVTSIERGKNLFTVKTQSGKVLTADAVVAGIGIQPNIELAQSAGLSVGNGIEIDNFCMTSRSGIYAAGDVANFFNPALGSRIRVEHEDNAVTMGEIAGKNMAGANLAYGHLPFFYSDLFDLGYEAVGELDAQLETVEDWKDEFREGVVYYTRDKLVRGVLLWNTWGQVDHARAIIVERKPLTHNDLIGRLPQA